MAFAAVVFAVSTLAGGVAALSGFGIGSLLTPLLALKFGMKAAVAAAAIPHFAATALRFWKIRRSVDKAVLRGFGLASAAGGLTGALLHARLQSPGLTLVFGLLLVFAGLSGLTGFSKRLHFSGAGAWLAGGLSGLFGGLVGNQGGIRAAALWTFALDKEALVATSTAIGLAIDFARLPVYAYADGPEIVNCWPWVAAGAAGVVFGTYAGVAALRRVPERWYGFVLSSLILALGVWTLVRLR